METFHWDGGDLPPALVAQVTDTIFCSEEVSRESSQRKAEDKLRQQNTFKPSATQRKRIIIDGISGSGKTTLAAHLKTKLNTLCAVSDVSVGGYSCRFEVLALDSWYPGWHGLSAGGQIAGALLHGQREDFPSWDWVKNEVAGLVPVDTAADWIVEGCGALTPTSAAASDLNIWVEADVEVAKSRALARDGETYAPWWQTWHEQELTHWQRDSPRQLADICVQTG